MGSSTRAGTAKRNARGGARGALRVPPAPLALLVALIALGSASCGAEGVDTDRDGRADVPPLGEATAEATAALISIAATYKTKIAHPDPPSSTAGMPELFGSSLALGGDTMRR